MDAERLSKQFLRSFSTKNGRGEWSFNGKDFETYFTVSHMGIRFWVTLLNDGERLQMRVSVAEVLRKPVASTDEDIGEFFGDTRFEQGFEWLAAIAVKRAQALETQIAEASRQYSEYEHAATVTAMRLSASIAAEKYKKELL